MRLNATVALTTAFGICVTLTGIQTSPAAPGNGVLKLIKKPTSAVATLTKGKALAETNGCNSCHGATYSGKTGFSPSIRATGITKKYTLKSWERVLNTGIAEDGKPVKKPMPVYHMAAKDSAPLYAYLKSLK